MTTTGKELSVHEIAAMAAAMHATYQRGLAIALAAKMDVPLEQIQKIVARKCAVEFMNLLRESGCAEDRIAGTLDRVLDAAQQHNAKLLGANNIATMPAAGRA